ncbi:MAG: MFS transporter [Chloroflexi bacterium]|nr:MFS transporter [Chloroflexota bacterium]
MRQVAAAHSNLVMRALFSSRKAAAYPLYLFMMATQACALTMVFTVNLVYQLQQVGLNPLQLELVGTTLELTAFLFAIPPGVVADVHSRRLSVIIGFALLGFGFLVEGGLPVFEALLVAQVIMGLGYTFLSGATSAWIADEIGQERAPNAFLRGSQVSQVVSFVSIFFSVAIASHSLQAAIIAGGVMLLCLSLFLLIVMPEAGFQRRSAGERENWRALFDTFRAGLAMICGSRFLLLILLATVFHGAFSEGFDRLWTAHLLANFEFPPLGGLDQIIWFGIISAVSMPLCLAATEVLRRRLDFADGRRVAAALIVVYVTMIGSVLLFVYGGSFAWALVGLWLAQAMRGIRNPLMEAWINQHTASAVRATVLSVQGQADALGQIAGGPLVGAVALLSSLRLAISLSALMLLPVLPVFRRSIRYTSASET